MVKSTGNLELRTCNRETATGIRSPETATGMNDLGEKPGCRTELYKPARRVPAGRD